MGVGKSGGRRLSRLRLPRFLMPRPRLVEETRCVADFIQRSKLEENWPNVVHQADLKGGPHKYALTVLDVASRYKETDRLRTAEVTAALSRIY